MNAPIDIEPLLEPLSPEAPCGECLEYAPEFTEMLAAATGKPEQQVGDSVVAAVAPSWAEVAGRCLALLEATRDLRVAVRLAQALLHVQGLPGLAAGLALVRGYLDRYWADLHPRLDAEDDFDPAIRVTAVALLCNLSAVVHPLRDSAPLLDDAVGRAITLGRMHAARSDDRSATIGAEIDAALAATPLPALQAMASAVRSARADAGAIEAIFAARAPHALTLDFAPLHKALAEIDAHACAWLARCAPEPVEMAGDVPATPDEEDCLPTDATAAPRANAGAIASREDALRVLGETCAWFRRHEPSHPVPILLERACRWIGMDFMDLLRDLAPDAVAEARKLQGASAPQ
jgi:type VI secretion system protein ImpA